VDITEGGTSLIAVAQSMENTSEEFAQVTLGHVISTTRTSIVMLALVDHNYKFLAVDVGSYGKDGDAGIFAKSSLGNNL